MLSLLYAHAWLACACALCKCETQCFWQTCFIAQDVLASAAKENGCTCELGLTPILQVSALPTQNSIAAKEAQQMSALSTPISMHIRIYMCIHHMCIRQMLMIRTACESIDIDRHMQDKYRDTHTETHCAHARAHASLHQPAAKIIGSWAINHWPARSYHSHWPEGLCSLIFGCC